MKTIETNGKTIFLMSRNTFDSYFRVQQQYSWRYLCTFQQVKACLITLAIVNIQLLAGN